MSAPQAICRCNEYETCPVCLAGHALRPPMVDMLCPKRANTLCYNANCLAHGCIDMPKPDLCGLAERESSRPGNVGQYDTSSVYEPIKVIEHYNLNFALGCAVKYVLRHGKKPGVDPIEDLEKARQNIDFEIARLRRLRAP